MIGEIISTGNEIMSGAIVDTNSNYLTQILMELIGDVRRHTAVGDDRSELKALFSEVATRSQLALVTGGLGPTTDDLTAEIAAQVAGVELVENERARESLENYFQRFNRQPRDNDFKQTRLPQGAECLVNQKGTAPGFAMEIDGCHFFFLPGVPTEMKAMFKEEVLPRIRDLGGGAVESRQVKIYSLFGVREADASRRLEGFEEEFPRLELGFRASFPRIQLRLYHGTEGKGDLSQAEEFIMDRVGKYVFSKEGLEMEEEVGKLLREKGETLAIAESCTGGLVGHMITRVPGSSKYFLFSAVTYSNEAKMEALGVKKETLEKHGAVHVETAREMAKGVREIVGATYGLATSGIAGPGGGTKEKPVGTICLALATPEEVKGTQFSLNFGDRDRNKVLFATMALDFLRREMTGEPQKLIRDES